VDSDGDAHNATLRFTNAKAKALGLMAGDNTAVDAIITFTATSRSTSTGATAYPKVS
jgi:hypothetical protein